MRPGRGREGRFFSGLRRREGGDLAALGQNGGQGLGAECAAVLAAGAALVHEHGVGQAGAGVAGGAHEGGGAAGAAHGGQGDAQAGEGAAGEGGGIGGDQQHAPAAGALRQVLQQGQLGQAGGAVGAPEVDEQGGAGLAGFLAGGDEAVAVEGGQGEVPVGGDGGFGLGF